MASTTPYVIVIVPDMGRPYVKPYKKGDLEAVIEAVGGYIQPIYKRNYSKCFRIHPMFAGEDATWATADEIIQTIGKRKTTRFWVNENGMNECSPNMGTIAMGELYQKGQCPHVWGNLAITMPKSYFDDNWELPNDPFAHEDEDEDEDE